ncbi:MAG: SPOR domain-containing protein [Bacillota bacterium]
MRRIFALIILTIVIGAASILFGQLLGGYYIYNLLLGDNLPQVASKQVKIPAPPVEKKMVLRLEPIDFYTIQVGVFSDVRSAQATIDRLVTLGFRPSVSSDAPYKIWLGCFSQRAEGKELEQSLQKAGFEAFIGKGLINDRALKFFSSNLYMKEKLAPALGKFDIAFNHSLKMFQSPKISTYELEIWEDMLKRLQDEVNESIKAIDGVLVLAESREFENELVKVKEKAVSYNDSLGALLKNKSDKGVLYSQSYLLELIGAYHSLISDTNHKQGIN